MGTKLLEVLQESIVCGDGAMGTELLASGVALDVCLEKLNVTEPDVVTKVHESYVDAGSQLLETNTFGANAVRLAKHGLENEVEALNEAAVKLAKKAAGNKDIWVAGSVGPLGIYRDEADAQHIDRGLLRGRPPTFEFTDSAGISGAGKAGSQRCRRKLCYRAARHGSYFAQDPD
jgi:methionine synthase I (cobalamin-dependent)